MKRLLTFLLPFLLFPGLHAQVVNPPSTGPVIAKVNLSAQTASVSTTSLYTAPAAGLYLFSCYEVVTTAATSSSTLPNCRVNFTDAETSVVSYQNATNTATGNTVGLILQGVSVINVAAGATISYSTANYASSGATAMAYSVHVRLQYLGP